MTATTHDEINVLTQSAAHLRPTTDLISHALAAVDVASLAHCHITEMHRIFSALVLLTKGNEEANGLAQVGDSLAERYQEEFFSETHRLEEELNALKGGA